MKVTDQKVAPAMGNRFAANRDQLRILTCGSVHDGKSTLIARLLLDASLVCDDHIETPSRDSKSHGTLPGGVDPTPLVEGREAEREQGTPIDVAYRCFATARRRFIVADMPGHKDYTRNMVAGASTSELAILLVDAEKGLLEQTRRDAFLCALLGIRQFVLAVNKMDLVGFDERRFKDIRDAFIQFTVRFPGCNIVAIPTSALHGDNVVRASARMSWYQGPALLECLEAVIIDAKADATPLRLPVQYVTQPNAPFRGYAGTVASGALRKGEEIMIPRTGARTRIARIVTRDGEPDSASAADAVTVVLADDIDVARGDIISSVEKPAQRADAFAAHLVWMSEAPLLPGRTYLLKAGDQTTGAMVTELKYRIDIENFDHLAAKELQLNEIAFANIAPAESISFDPYEENRNIGGFVLIDRHTNATVAAGLISFGLRRSANTYFQAFEVTKVARAQLNAQKPALLWFTGLSGAGKSTIADNLEKKLHALGKHTFVLDGDNVRHGLNRDLGFTEGDRVENIRRVAEVAKLFVEAGLITLVAFISPFRAEREMARELVDPGEFIEIFVDTPLAACERRDPKGLYKKARRGELQNFTGLDSPYEQPRNPELILDALNESPGDLADRIIDFMRRRDILT